MPQGTIKGYDEETHQGTLLTDDGTEVTIDPRSAEGSGILTLRIGQRVRFDLAQEDGGPVARGLRLVTFV